MRTSPSAWSSDDPLVCDTNIVLSGLLGRTTRQLIFDIDRDEPLLSVHRSGEPPEETVPSVSQPIGTDKLESF